MITQEIYELALKMGMKADLRGIKQVNKYLEKYQKSFDKLNAERKKEFDKEKLTNPYSDTRILISGKKEVKKVIAGIDVEVPEILLAQQLGGVDLAIAHHPEGCALADLHSVMDLQSQILADLGVPINVAEGIMRPRISEVSRGIAPANHNRAVDAAKLLNIDFICVHTPADNLAANFVDKEVKKKKPETVEDVIEILKKIPEYKEAAKANAGPRIFVGSPENSCGKVVVSEFTGGTNGAKEIYEKMSHAGVGTIISMHMGEEHRKEAEKNHINVVVAGHIASDSLGMNLFLDELEKKGIEVVPISGLIRVKRFK